MGPKIDRKSTDTFSYLICHLNINSKEKSVIKCDYCDGLSHITCVNISPDILNSTNSMDRKG